MKLAVNPYTSKPRQVNNLALIVNPTDYFTKIMPATTVQSTDGTYKNNVLPVPTTIIQSEQVPEGKAILGMINKYAMGLGSGSTKGGKIEYSDEYKFLEDQRYYIVKLIGNGQAYDDNCFLLLDISGLKENYVTVSIADTVKTKEQA